MRNTKDFLGYAFLIFILIMTGCATIKPPDGGVKDVDPPMYADSSSVPLPHNRTNFSSDKVILVYSENIGNAKLEQELRIIPRITDQIDFTIKKNKLIIEVPDLLSPNTTYMIQTGSGVQDLTERNIAPSVVYAFSTGSYLDSLTLKGKIVDHKSRKPVKDVVVGLYPTSDSLDITKQEPYYYTYTNPKGIFRFLYLKEGNYRLIAFGDKNMDLTWNSKNEKIAFSSDIVVPAKIDSSIQLFAFSQRDTLLSLNSVIPQNGSIKLTFNHGVRALNIESNDLDSNFSIKSDENQKIHYLYPLTLKTDSISIRLQAEDSLGLSMDTSLYSPLQKRLNPDKKLINKSEYTDNQTINTTFNTPIHKVDTSLLFIRFTKDSTRDTLRSSILKHYRIGEQRLSIQFVLHDSIPDTCTLTIPDSTFINIFGESSTKQTIRCIKQTSKQGATLSGHVEGFIKNPVIQLLVNNTIISTVYHTKTFQFDHLGQGDYSFYVYDDRNRNKHQDDGDYFRKIQPEVGFTSNSINLKEGWMMDNIKIEYE
jgi:hypothetical protein